MSDVYCQSCFKKTAQTVDIVKFCSHCGKPFINIDVATTKPEKKVSPPPSSFNQAKLRILAKQADIQGELDEVEDDDDLDDVHDSDDENLKVPRLSQLEVDVEIPKANGAPIRSVASGAKRKDKPTSSNTKGKKFNKKQFLKEFQKQSSAIRSK